MCVMCCFGLELYTPTSLGSRQCKVMSYESSWGSGDEISDEIGDRLGHKHGQLRSADV